MQVKPQGSALITALFIMTLVAIAATAMSTRLQLDIYRTHLAITSDKLYLASQGVTFWAMNTLSTKNRHHLISREEGKVADYPTALQNAYPDVVSTGRLYDLHAFFNLNNLQDIKFHSLFFRLVEGRLKTSTGEQRKKLINSIHYWTSTYQPSRGHDEELDFYLKQKPAYLPSYQPMQSISELRLIHGVSAESYQSLVPLLTVLPEKTRINLNTAPRSLLMTLGNGLNDSDVDELLQKRGAKGFKNFNKIGQLLQNLDIPGDQITIESQYFLSVSTVSSEDLNLVTYTVLKRIKDRSEQPLISIISERLNTI